MNKSAKVELQDRVKNIEKSLMANDCLKNFIFRSYSCSLVNLKKIPFCFGILVFLSGCSMEANIQSFSQMETKKTSRKEPDFIHGERVTTLTGHHQITGVFGEISATKKSINKPQWEFKEVFHE